MSIKGKFGQFLFFLGSLALIIFFATVLNKEPLYSLLFLGLVGIVLGGILWARDGTPPQPSGRFRAIRTARQKFAENRAEKKKAEKK
ncbi:MAG TPA: hypothetical protein VJ436_06960 [Anaerolineales bacterium]|nr:hypothetical protein [Anaerolineales bacterium]